MGISQISLVCQWKLRSASQGRLKLQSEIVNNHHLALTLITLSLTTIKCKKIDKVKTAKEIAKKFQCSCT